MHLGSLAPGKRAVVLVLFVCLFVIFPRTPVAKETPSRKAHQQLSETRFAQLIRKKPQEHLCSCEAYVRCFGSKNVSAHSSSAKGQHGKGTPLPTARRLRPPNGGRIDSVCLWVMTYTKKVCGSAADHLSGELLSMGLPLKREQVQKVSPCFSRKGGGSEVRNQTYGSCCREGLSVAGLSIATAQGATLNLRTQLTPMNHHHHHHHHDDYY